MLAFVLVLSLSGCDTYDNFKAAFFTPKTGSEDQIRIAIYEPLSGSDKKFGKLEVMGIELAHKISPTAIGKEVVLEYVDNKSNMYVAETVIQELVTRKPSLVLGSYGSVYSLTAAKYLEEAKIPAITITNSNPLITGSNPYYFRVCYIDAYEGIAVAKYAVEKRKVTKAAILRPCDNDFADAVTRAFANKMIQLTGDNYAIAITQIYTPGNTDFTKLLQSIKDSGAQAIFVPASVADAATILKQAKEISLNAIFLGTGQWETQKLVEQAGKEAVEGIAFSTNFDPSTALTDTTSIFLKAYMEEYGKDAVPQSATALGFDAYLLAIDAINRAGSAREGDLVREALANTRQFPGASGSITFNEQGDPVKSVVIKTVRNGEIINEYTVEPNWAAAPAK